MRGWPRASWSTIMFWGPLMALPPVPCLGTGSGSLLSISTSVLHPLSSSASTAEGTVLVRGILILPVTSPVCRQSALSTPQFASGWVRAAGGGWAVLLLPRQPLWGRPRQCLFLDHPLPSAHCLSRVLSPREILTACGPVHVLVT